MQRLINIGAGIVLLICLVLVLSDCGTNKGRVETKPRGERAALLTEKQHIADKAHAEKGRFADSDITFVSKVERDVPGAGGAGYARIIEIGKLTCSGLKVSVSSATEMRVFVDGYLRAASQNMPRSDAVDFLGLSIGTYCPQYIKYLR